MLKISKTGSDNNSITFKLEGQVAGPWVGELSDTCEPILGEGLELRLDLSDVTFADASGVRMLCALISKGVAVTNCSSFVKELLKCPPPV